jgi:RecB family exonuclease
VFISGSARARRSFLADWLRQQIAVRARGPWDAASPLLLLGPSLEALRSLLADALEDREPLAGVTRVTLRQLAYRLATPVLAREGLLPAAPAALRAVMARTLHRAAARPNGLGNYAPMAEGPGLATALLRTIDDLRMADVSPREEPLASLHALFLEELARDHLADTAKVFSAAIEAVDTMPRGALGVLDVPLDAHLAASFAERLLQRHGTAGLALERRSAWLGFVDAARVRSGALAFSDTLFAREGGGGSHEVSEANRDADANAHNAHNAPADATERTCDVSPLAVTLFSAPGEGREAVEIARFIQTRARQGVRFDAMAVVLRQPEHYRLHLADVFRRAAIPAYFARGARKPNAAGRSLLALLHCLREGLSAARFAEYLSLGQLPDLAKTGAAPRAEWVPPLDEAMREVEEEAALPGLADAVDEDAPMEEHAASSGPRAYATPRLWERLIVDASVVSGLERWDTRLRGRAEALRLSAEAAAEGRDARLAEAAALDALRTFAMPILAALDALPRTASWGAWVGALGDLAQLTLAAPESVLVVLAELAPMRDVGPVGLSEVLLTLEPRLQEVRVPPQRSAAGAVFVGAIDDAAGQAFDTVFVPGLAERMFPPRIEEDPLLPDRARAELSARLGRSPARAELERARLVAALSLADAHLYVSYSRMDVDGARPRTPSFYALEVLRAVRGQPVGFAELSQAAEADVETRLGWPAPTDAFDAIDQMEHDLSVLERVLGGDERDSEGLARYLLAQNEHLGRALRARALRWASKWNGADGLVELSEAAKTALARHAPSARSFSPTALQHFAACPYRFYLQAICRLAPREGITSIEELDALERGSLVHEAQFRLLLGLRERGLLPIRPEGREAAFALLDETVTQVAEEYRERLAPTILRVWEDGVAAIRADIREWLRRCERDTDYLPVFFELSFGLKDQGTQRDPNSSEAPAPVLDGKLLRGSIDLVEVSHRGGLRATDFKTGKVRAKEGDVIQQGAVLQPVLYALVLEALLPSLRASSTHKMDHVEGGRLYYSTHQGMYTTVDFPLDGEARAAAGLVFDTVAQALSHGFLPAAPEEGGCTYCDYREVCGPYEELRVKRKAPRPLTGLKRLRGHR